MADVQPPKPGAGMPAWKKYAIVAAAILLFAGVGLRVYASANRASRTAQSVKSAGADRRSPDAGKSLAGNSLVAGGSQSPGGTTTTTTPGSVASPQTAQDTPSMGEKVSPVCIAGGVSFFAGLAIGSVLRIFFKIALAIAGVGFLAVFGLSYLNVIPPIDWKTVDQKAGQVVGQVQEKAQGFLNDSFVSLPSAGLAGAGLVSGLKRK
jgi:uncharacterized membrane protein (Fun14 family)